MGIIADWHRRAAGFGCCCLCFKLLSTCTVVINKCSLLTSDDANSDHRRRKRLVLHCSFFPCDGFFGSSPTINQDASNNSIGRWRSQKDRRLLQSRIFGYFVLLHVLVHSNCVVVLLLGFDCSKDCLRVNNEMWEPCLWLLRRQVPK